MSDLARLRREAGRTQVQVAVEAGVSPPTVRAYERAGAAGVPDERLRQRVERVFDELRLEVAQRRRRAA